MPLSEAERLELVTRVAEVIGDFDGDGGAVHPGVQQALEGLLRQMTALTEMVTVALGNAMAAGGVAINIPTPQQAAPERAADPAKPAGKPRGRPAGKKA